ncbi:unnamed protein product [Amaranthus hypochondriacus]
MVEPAKARCQGRPRKTEAQKSTVTAIKTGGGSSKQDLKVQVREDEYSRSEISNTPLTLSLLEMATQRNALQQEKGKGTHLETDEAGGPIQQVPTTVVNQKLNTWAKIVRGGLEEEDAPFKEPPLQPPRSSAGEVSTSQPVTVLKQKQGSDKHMPTIEPEGTSH